MLYLMWYVRKHYEWLNWHVNLDYKALNKSKFVIVHQISGLIFNCVSNIIDTLCSSVKFILGQELNPDKEYFMKLQETYYLGISFGFSTIALIMFLSFIKLYSSGITDINYVDPIFPYLFVALNVLMYARRTSSQIINFAVHFK